MIVLLLWSLAACQEEPECSETTPCAFGAVCEEGVCVTIPCSTSAQCGMEEYCDNRSCVAGCAEDSDCRPGDICNTEFNTCEPRSCRSTDLDCDFKEFCDQGSGECYEAGGYYCKPCDGDDDCGGNENLCLGFGSSGSYCGVTCETNDDCPASFDCLPIGDISGNIVSYQCLTYCWLYDEDGEGGAPPVGLPMPEPEPVCDVTERA